mmetsp:Transcript_10847/g.14602  ORF Transcript_10847/g.14602 Transcript_10847/m.14602 type:complete len:102 (+) Transcript_10847:1775-2080(+)
MVEQGDARNKLNIRQGFGNKYASQVYREQRIDVLLYVKGEPSKKLLLENVLVSAEEITGDILSQMSAEFNASFESLFGANQDPIIAMPNANIKGYCRALLD